MNMGMGMYLIEEQSQKMALVGGATLSIFPQAENWLLFSADNYEALQFVARRKNMERYHSMMDFLFCEIFIEYQKHCFLYYNKKGPLLKEMISEEQIVRYDAILLKALKIAYKVFREKQEVSWGWFRTEVPKSVA